MKPTDIIIHALRKGQGNAIKCADLEELTQLDNREVRRCIEQLRRSGVVICSSDDGYFYPETRAELQEFIHKEAARAHSIEITLRSAERLFSEWGGDSP